METLRYHSFKELRKLSLGQLQALWELVPTDRQRAYKAAYEREVRSAGAVGSDQLERQVTLELLKRYVETGLIPIGSRWARTPGRVQEAAQQNIGLDAPEAETTQAGKPSRKLLLMAGALAVMLFVVLFARSLAGRTANTPNTTPSTSLTPTARVSPTSTPLALEAQDEVIQGGDGGREVAYPVSLQVILPADHAPRLWVVQRRAVRASEWNFDPNPDTASFVNGMSVRPVIGVPYSPENAAFFDAIGTGANFLLTMNTGAVLRFDFAERRDVRRSETDIFRQINPGLVLLLIGETGEDGLPSATRALVMATYPPEQELSRDGQMIGLGVAVQEGDMGETLALGEAALTLQTARLLADAPTLPPDSQYLLLNFDAQAGAEAVNTTTWRMELVDAAGQVYTPNSAALTTSDFAALPPELPALTARSASVAYLVPRSLQTGRWLVTDAAGNSLSYPLTFSPAPLDLHYTGVDVQVVSVTHLDGQLTVRLRVYNGRNELLPIVPDDLWLALGYAENPPGPRTPAEGLAPFDLLPEQAADLTLLWPWNGEPYGSLGVGEYLFGIQIAQSVY